VSANPQLESVNPGNRTRWHEGILDLPNPFQLECGASLRCAQLAWQCVGPDEAPLIIALGGISAHRRACARDGRGWFEAQCGEGRALDITRYRVLGIDWLGGVDDSSGPRGASDFQAISAADQARALLLLLNRLGVRRVHLLVGASYGGNVAQQLAALLGDRLRHLVQLCAAHQPSQFGLALRQVQRTILDLGDDADTALALARSLAVLGYRTPEGIEARFGGDISGGEVSSWLDHHGAKFAARFDAAAYRVLSASIDAHRIDPAMIHAPTTLLAVREDLIVPLSLAREYAYRAPHCELIEISSPYGHDGFLKEEREVGNLLRAALEERV
jgi:homoserine O-acetyltransferase